MGFSGGSQRRGLECPRASPAAAGTAALWSPSIYAERFNAGDSHFIREKGEKLNISPLGREIHRPRIPVYKTAISASAN